MPEARLKERKLSARLLSAGAGACVSMSLLAAGDAVAATATQNINVSMTIQGECKINAATNMSFGTRGTIDANFEATSTMDVQCTNTTPYTVGLNAGLGTGATTTTRKMTLSGATVDYQLFRDSGRSQNWGNTPGTDTHAGTGSGSVQQLTIYGRVPQQTTPAPGVYQDTVQITVTY